MKKLLCVIMILCMIPVISLANDLDSMSYDDLIELSRQVTAEIMSRPEWKEVAVPTGTWVVGVDIPVGFYSIKATDNLCIVKLEDKNGGFVFYQTMSKDEVCGKAEFAAGSILNISDPVILAPPISLGF